MSLAVQSIDSIRWRIGARWGPWAALVLAARTDDLRFELGKFGFEALAAEVLVADQDQRLARLALAAREERQADLLLVELGAGQRQRPGRAIEREQGIGELRAPRHRDQTRTRPGWSRPAPDCHRKSGLWRANSAISASIRSARRCRGTTHLGPRLPRGRRCARPDERPHLRRPRASASQVRPLKPRYAVNRSLLAQVIAPAWARPTSSKLGQFASKELTRETFMY